MSMYILKLLLNAVIAGIEALVTGNTFLFACLKMSAACERSHVFISSVSSSLLLKRCDLNQLLR
jgi:hypothetical protein